MLFDTRTFLGSPGNEVVQKKKRHWRQGSPVLTVILLLMVTLGLVCFSWAILLNNLDDRVFVTTTDTFHDWMALRDLFTGALNFSKLDNPPNLSMPVFDPFPDSMQEWQDLRNREVITPAQYDLMVANKGLDDLRVLQNGKSLLWSLLRISWCSYPNALPGTTPITRSPGCDCIAQSYLGFVRDSLNTSRPLASAVTVNSTAAIRDKYSKQVLTCFDRRQVSRTQTCGLVCSIHLAGVVLYSNIILLLCLLSYLLFSEHGAVFKSCSTGPGMQTLIIKVFIAAVAVGLSTAFFLQDVTANVLNLVGIIVCVVYNTLTLHDELNFPAMDEAMTYKERRFTGGEIKPHPLTVTLLVHLQLILPAYGAVFAISGYGRDVWALLCFAGTLWLMGLTFQVSPVFARYTRVFLLGLTFQVSPVFARYTRVFFISTEHGSVGCCWQRFYWSYWYNDRDDSLVNQTSLTACFFALLILLILLFVAYRFEQTLYISGSVWVFSLVCVYLVLMMGMLIGDRLLLGFMDEENSTFYFSVYQQGMLLLTVAVNLILTVVALVDVMENKTG